MRVKEGEYKGALCTLLVSKNTIKITVDETQIELLKFYKNYDFGFDDEGNLTGTGAGVPIIS